MLPLLRAECEKVSPDSAPETPPAATPRAKPLVECCPALLWGEFRCRRPRHPRGTAHMYDIRRAQQ